MAPTAFAYFPRLPLELRLQIWRLCLPSRVVEVDQMPDDHFAGFKKCWLFETSEKNNRPPVLSQVCSESRQLACKTGGLATLDPKHLPELTSSWPMHECLWFDPTADIMHLNYDGRLWCNSRFNYMGGTLKHFLSRLPQDSGAPKASIMADLMFPFDPLADWDLGSAIRWNPNPLKQRRSYLAVVEVIILHVTMEQALQSSLFGRLGEERIKLVDRWDLEYIRDYYELYLQGPEEDTQPRPAFDKLLHDESWGDEQHVARWKDNTRKIWGVNEQINDYTAWIPLPDDLLELNAGESSEDIYSGYDGALKRLWRIDPIKHVPKMDHPWTRERLACIPDCRPVVMFRLCLQECHLDPGLNLDSDSS
jgi:hypothetical protein